MKGIKNVIKENKIENYSCVCWNPIQIGENGLMRKTNLKFDDNLKKLNEIR